ncbi:MAG: SRPBCC family protein [Mobilicoccus sp.]|nr:SRPBCC family protein [Mobilicoccus sp.]
MAEFVESVTIACEPKRLFDYLCDVGNLPSYMPRLKAAEPIGDGAVEVVATPRLPDGSTPEVRGRAWTRVDEADRSFSWGAVGGRHGYHGSFEIDPEGEGSRLVVRLNSERADSDAVRAGLQDVLASIRKTAEAPDTAN